MYQVQWILENRIALFRPLGDQTLETFEDGVNRLMQCLDTGIPPIHVINDNHHLGKFPINLRALSQLTILSKNKNAGYTVSIGGNPMTNFVSTMLSKISGGDQVEFRNTIPEAIHLLKTLDRTLPDEINYTDNTPQQAI